MEPTNLHCIIIMEDVNQDRPLEDGLQGYLCSEPLDGLMTRTGALNFGRTNGHSECGRFQSIWMDERKRTTMDLANWIWRTSKLDSGLDGRTS